MNDCETQTRGTMTSEQDKHQVFIARQPIFDRNLEIYGYELLFRGSIEAQTAVIASNTEAQDTATSTVMLNSIMEFDLSHLVGQHKAFFNLSREFLLAGTDLPFSSSNVGIEVLEDSEVDDELIQALEHLKLLGYEIALDDFSWRQGIERVLNIASLVKVDIQETPREELAKLVEQLREYGVALVAEKVETQEEFKLCQAMNFEYYQGFFLCRPTTMSARRLPESKLNTMRLLSKLEEPEVQARELEEIIQHDVTLNYRLLRTVNSAFYGLSVKIKSVSHAIVYLGIPTIKSWARLLALSGIEDRPSELVRIALVRARMCQLLTTSMSKDTSDAAFTVGLFSLLDAMLDVPMELIIEQLPLDEQLIEGLGAKEGPYGRLLKSVIAYERGQWDQIDEDLYSMEKLGESYMNAIEWAHQQYQTMTAGQ